VVLRSHTMSLGGVFMMLSCFDMRVFCHVDILWNRYFDSLNPLHVMNQHPLGRKGHREKRLELPFTQWVHNHPLLLRRDRPRGGQAAASWIRHQIAESGCTGGRLLRRQSAPEPIRTGASNDGDERQQGKCLRQGISHILLVLAPPYEMKT
jgi:hypothetical protein